MRRTTQQNTYVRRQQPCARIARLHVGGAGAWVLLGVRWVCAGRGVGAAVLARKPHQASQWCDGRDGLAAVVGELSRGEIFEKNHAE